MVPAPVTDLLPVKRYHLLVPILLFKEPTMPTIVISYRREDTRWIVGRIFDRLVEHYGHNNIFMDIDAVPLGSDYRDQIRSTLQRSDILLAVIGPQWLAVQKETGQPRLSDESDWVRIEIEAALGKKIPVIPVLIDRARLPKPTELPEALREFAYRQAADVDTGVDFQSHMDRLIRSMDQLLERDGDATKLSARPKSSPTERDSSRSALGLLNNSNLDTAPNTAVGDISNSIMGPIGGVRRWVTRQAVSWFQIVKSPKDFLTSIDLVSPEEFGKSVQFLLFIIVVDALLQMPLDALNVHQRIFEPTAQFAQAILSAIDAFVYGSATWLFGRAIRGKGQYRGALIGAFYSTAFYPFFAFGLYAGFSNPKAPSGTFVPPPNPDPVIAWTSAIVSLVVFAYVAMKLISLIKCIHSIGPIRASVVFALAVTATVGYEFFIKWPFYAQLIQAVATK
jgi:hypothetical protein